MNKQKKGKKRAERLKELEALVKASGLINLQQYSFSHFRLFGPTVVDYWPGSGRCWVTGSNGKSTKMTPAEAVALAVVEPLPPEALEHMKSISQQCVPTK